MRRIGSTPAEWGSTGYNNCPDVLELDTGDFLVIGALVGRGVLLTDEEQARMRELGASVGVNEAIVEVPREVSRRAPRCELRAGRLLRSARPLTWLSGGRDRRRWSRWLLYFAAVQRDGLGDKLCQPPDLGPQGQPSHVHAPRPVLRYGADVSH
ncbi:hypothetical protein ABT124_49790 [Streptomyces sp. NPDC001982]|uniref:hypothetical protein n=1 Tax=Streptomyces sp. NPDC001982 TaxID=3154405 RepID=UPI003325E50C